jgi:putative transposase
MPKKRFSAKQVVTLLRQIEVSLAQGKSAPVACRDAGISQQTPPRPPAPALPVSS